MRHRLLPAAMLLPLLQACAGATPQAQPALQTSLEPLAGFIGSRQCAGSFLKSGKAINATETVSADLSGYRLTLRHDDAPPFSFHALELWGYDAKAGRFTARVYDNFGGDREFTSPGWEGGRFTWSNVDTSAAKRDRFVFEKEPGGYRYTYEVSTDGATWTGVDSLLCLSPSSSPGGT